MEARQQQAKEAFDLFAKAGYLPLSHVPIVLRALDLNPSQKELKALLERLRAKPDLERQGIDFKAFQTEATQLMVRPFDTKDAVIAAFRVFDRDGSGEIPLADLQHVMTSMGEALSEDEWRALTATLGDVVRYEDFAQELLKSYPNLGSPDDLDA